MINVDAVLTKNDGSITPSGFECRKQNKKIVGLKCKKKYTKVILLNVYSNLNLIDFIEFVSHSYV